MTLKHSPTRDPAEVLKALVASEVEVIRLRDPELASALDVEPPVQRDPTFQRQEPPPAIQHGLVYQSAKRVYRVLDRVSTLRPLLTPLRLKVLELRVRRENRRRTKTPKTPAFPCITRSFTIAFTMRSGSNEICNLLAKNGLGSPSEFFQNPLPTNEPGSVLEGLARIINQHQVDGIFGSKMSHDHRARLDEQLRSAIPGYSRIDDLFPHHRWVWLVRKDKILQAISWCRAEASHQWISGPHDAAKPGEYGYDFFAVLSRTMLIYGGELAWETYFRENSIKPLIVVYEDFFRDLEHQLRGLIDYLGGLPTERASLDTSTTFEIQRNEKSYAVRQRFISDLGRMGEQSMSQELGESLNKWGRFFFEQGWRV